MRRIRVDELQPRDWFSFKGFTQKHNGYTLREIEYIGGDLFRLVYSSNNRWRTYDTLKRGHHLVWVAPVGRFYNS